jgi:hypothetical protein
MPSELQALHAVFRVAIGAEARSFGPVDVHRRIAMRDGGAVVMVDGFADLITDGRPEALWIGSTGDVVLPAQHAVEYELARMAESLFEPGEVGQHLGLRGIRIALWDLMSVPRRYESSPEFTEWLHTATARRGDQR